MTETNNRKAKMFLDESPFPKTKIDYRNDSTMQTVQKLRRELKKLKEHYQG